MRIKSLYIKRYKILENLFIDFDEKTNVNVIIGKNGAGKTTLFEAIIHIFRELSLASSGNSLKSNYNELDLEFEINYLCKGSEITFRSLYNKDGLYDLTFKINGGDEFPLSKGNLRAPIGQESDFTSKPIFQYLPDHIVTYYSGESSRVTSLFEEHLTTASKALQKGQNLPLREFINIDTTSVAYVLLSLLPYLGEGRKDSKSQILSEDSIISAQIKFKQPSWLSTARNKFEKLAELSSEDALEQFNPELYYAEGEVGQFIDNLSRFSQKEFDGEFISSLTFRADDAIEFINSDQDLNIKNSLDFFKMLDHTLNSELIDQLIVRIKLKDSTKDTSLVNLSEGEHQIKLVIGLNEIFKGKETLFLYDEPDTYLHPEWQILLMENLLRIKDSQVFVNTHSTIALNRLGKEGNSQIFILEKGKLLGLPQTIKSFGASSDAILKVFQRVEEKLPANFMAKIKDAQQLINAGNLKEAKSILQTLKEFVGDNNREIINLETLIEIKEL